MVIRNINSFFARHSRWLFGGFTVIIIVSFMGFLTPGGGGCGGLGDPTFGTVFGRKVGIEELGRQKRLDDLAARLGLAAEHGGDPEQLFQEIAVQEAAARRGITVSDRMIARAIREYPGFRENGGAFNYDFYRDQVLPALARFGATQEDVDAVFRQRLAQQLLTAELFDSIIVTANEVESAYRVFGQQIKLQVADFKSADYLAKVPNSNEKIRAYFTANQSGYRIPERYKAVFACVGYDAPELAAEAEKLATPAALLHFYRSNPFYFPGDNAAEAKAIPADKLASVKTNFLAQTVKQLATARVQEFARDVPMNPDDPAAARAAFLALAADRGMKTAESTEFFAADAPQVAGIADPVLAYGVAQMYEGSSLSNAIPGARAAYVALVTEREAARDALFNECSAKVIADYRNAEALALARRAAEDFLAGVSGLPAAQAEARIKESKRFTALPVYSAFELPKTPTGMAAAQAVEPTPAGDFSPVFQTADGVAIAFVEQRIPADPAKLEERRALLTEFVRRNKQQAAVLEFSKNLSAQCKVLLGK